jgi:deoxyribose-phosphate aldolase
MDEPMQLELALNQPEITGKDIQEATFLAIENKVTVLSVPMAYLAMAKEYLEGTNIKLAAHIDSPYGQNPTELKQAAIILAERRGAKIVEVGLNYGWVLEERFADLKHELTTLLDLAKNYKVDFRLVTEYRLFDEANLELWAEFISKAGVDCIISSFGLLMDDPSDNLLICKRLKGCKLLPASNLWQEKHIEMAKTAKTKVIRYLNLPLFRRHFTVK